MTKHNTLAYALHDPRQRAPCAEPTPELNLRTDHSRLAAGGPCVQQRPGPRRLFAARVQPGTQSRDLAQGFQHLQPPPVTLGLLRSQVPLALAHGTPLPLEPARTA